QSNCSLCDKKLLLVQYYCFSFSFYLLLIIQRKLLPLCVEIFMSLGTQGLWMRKDMSGLLEELTI
uniref:Uncharacterized protein n=1 Tax=Accipiter nisus TaxID=211598 RepID=A0A8B9M7F4_9AVES